jgi:acyl carrier protein
MTNEEVFNDLKIILSEEFEVEEELITLSASFYDEMGLDSLDAIDLVVNISDKYNIDIGNKAIEETKTIQQLIDAVLDKLNN